MQDVAPDIADRARRGIGEGRSRKPELAGSDVAQDLRRRNQLRPLCIARSVQAGGGSAEQQGQPALPGPQTVELPAAIIA